MIAGKIIDLLGAECDSPLDVYMVIKFIQDGFEDQYNIRGRIVYGPEAEKDV